MCWYASDFCRCPSPCVCRRTSRAEIEDALARRHNAPGHVATGVHAAAGGVGAKAAAAPDPLPWCAGPLIYNFGRAARPGSAASARVADAGRTARRMRGELCAPPPRRAELGPAVQASVSARPRAPACGQALQTAGAKSTTVDRAARRHRSWGWAAPGVCGTDGIGRTTRVKRQTTPKRDSFRLRCPRSTDLSHLQRPTQTRWAPRSGCHGEGKKGV